VTLLDACRTIMSNGEMMARYPKGLSSADVLTEIRSKWGAFAFPFVTVIDVADEMRSFYGPGKS
jgi:hypothetical protein